MFISKQYCIYVFLILFYEYYVVYIIFYTCINDKTKKQ